MYDESKTSTVRVYFIHFAMSLDEFSLDTV